MLELEHTHELSMRTNIDIDDALLGEAMQAAGLTTKKATVEAALRQMVDAYRRRSAVASLAGIGWDGDLASMREGRSFDRGR